MSKSTLSVGSLSYDANEDALREAFGQFGDFPIISIGANRETDRHDWPAPSPIFLGLERDNQSRAVPACPALDLLIQTFPGGP